MHRGSVEGCPLRDSGDQDEVHRRSSGRVLHGFQHSLHECAITAMSPGVFDRERRRSEASKKACGQGICRHVAHTFWLHWPSVISVHVSASHTCLLHMTCHRNNPSVVGARRVEKTAHTHECTLTQCLLSRKQAQRVRRAPRRRKKQRHLRLGHGPEHQDCLIPSRGDVWVSSFKVCRRVAYRNWERHMYGGHGSFKIRLRHEPHGVRGCWFQDIVRDRENYSSQSQEKDQVAWWKTVQRETYYAHTSIIMYQIFSFFDRNKTQGRAMSMADLLNIELRNDNLMQFNQAWEEIVFSSGTGVDEGRQLRLCARTKISLTLCQWDILLEMKSAVFTKVSRTEWTGRPDRNTTRRLSGEPRGCWERCGGTGGVGLSGW